MGERPAGHARNLVRGGVVGLVVGAVLLASAIAAAVADDLSSEPIRIDHLHMPADLDVPGDGVEDLSTGRYQVRVANVASGRPTPPRAGDDTVTVTGPGGDAAGHVAVERFGGDERVSVFEFTVTEEGAYTIETRGAAGTAVVSKTGALRRPAEASGATSLPRWLALAGGLALVVGTVALAVGLARSRRPAPPVRS